MPAMPPHAKDAPPPSLEDRRGAVRARAQRPGVIVYGPLPHHFDCTIFDISDKGTRIHFKLGQIIPNTCQLIDVQKARLYTANLVWKQAPAAALLFDESFDLAAPLPPHLDHLHRVWREISAPI